LIPLQGGAELTRCGARIEEWLVHQLDEDAVVLHRLDRAGEAGEAAGEGSALKS
jgi:hypothetical protein